MVAFLKVLMTSGKNATTVEDIFITIGVLIYSLEAEFARYVDAFAPYLYAALQNHAEYQLCSISVGLVGDLCRALGDKIQPYCDQLMTYLIQNLQSDILHRDVKPNILSCFGDIALAIGCRYEAYLVVSMTVL